MFMIIDNSFDGQKKTNVSSFLSHLLSFSCFFSV